MKILKQIKWWVNRNNAMLRRPNGKYILRQEKRMRAEFNRIFKSQLEYCINAFSDFYAFTNTNTLNDDIDRVLNDMPGKRKLVETIIVYASNTMLKGGQTSVKNLALGNFGISFDMKNAGAVKYLRDKATLELSNNQGNIDSRTKEKIKNIVIKAIQNGQSYQDTALQIRQQGDAGVFSQARAELIAVREAGQAYEFGSRQPIIEFSSLYPDRKVLKEWLTVGDDQVTAECQANEEMGEIPFEQYFDYDVFQQTAPRNNNPRCRCTVSYRIEEPS